MVESPETRRAQTTAKANPDAMRGRPNLASIPRLSWRRIALLIALGLLSVALMLALGGGREAVDALTQVDLRFVGTAMLVHYSGFVVRGLRWQQLLGVMGHRLTYLFTTSVLLAGWFVSALLPARAGDIVRIAVLRLQGADRAPVPVADSLGSIVLERALDITAILMLGAGFSLLVVQNRLPTWVVTAYAIGVGLLAVLGAMIVVSPALLNWLRHWSSHHRWAMLVDFAAQFVSSLRTLFRHPTTALLVAVESLYIWLCDVALLWLAVRSLGGSISYGEAGFVALTVDMIAAVPLTPGGIGQIEAAYVALLALLAGTAFNTAAVVLVTRLVSYWSFLLFSGVVTFAAGFGAILMNEHRDVRDKEEAQSYTELDLG